MVNKMEHIQPNLHMSDVRMSHELRANATGAMLRLTCIASGPAAAIAFKRCACDRGSSTQLQGE